jgi:hypothetical protein
MLARPRGRPTTLTLPIFQANAVLAQVTCARPRQTTHGTLVSAVGAGTALPRVGAAGGEVVAPPARRLDVAGGDVVEADGLQV